MNQTGNQAGGDIAGGNISNYYYAEGLESCMASLIERYREEVENNEEFEEFVETLQFYQIPSDPDERLSLEDKLRAAGRESEINLAQRAKELFSKRLHKHHLRKAAQEIYGLILGMIHSLFQAKIVPLLEASASKAAIDTSVANEVIDPIWRTLGENPLIITHQELRGIVYYLTGHCYLRWTEE